MIRIGVTDMVTSRSELFQIIITFTDSTEIILYTNQSTDKLELLYYYHHHHHHHHHDEMFKL